MFENGLHDLPAGKLSIAVTLLEMREPPSLRRVSLPDDVIFRPITPDPARYRDLFSRVGANWFWFSRLAMSDAALTDIIKDPDVKIFTLSRDGVDEALLELDFRKPETCELAYFGLTPTLIGKGAGRYLMNQAITLAWAQPIKRFHLHTCNHDSPQALPFYIRSGFTPYARRIEIADDPRLSGVLPETAAPQVPLIRA